MPSRETELVNLFVQSTPMKSRVNLRPLQQAKSTMTEDEEQEEEVEQEKGAEPPQSMYLKYHIKSEEMIEQMVWSIAPKEAEVSIGNKDDNNDNKHVYYYLHGGTYFDGFTNQDWDFLSKLVDRLHCTVTAPDYPLAPDHDVHDVFAMITPLYNELVENIGPSNLTLMGDSAGGGMSLALAQWLRNEEIEQPSSIILFSPWLDVTMKNPDISRVAGRVDSSSLLEIKELKKRGEMYAGKKMEPMSHLVSPIYGSLEGLAPITLFVRSNDLFVADCRKLKSKAESRGITLDYQEFVR